MVVRLVSLAISLLILTFSQPALSQDVERAKAEYKEGYRLLQKKQYKEALEHYEASYDEAPRPRTLYNIALCHEALGHNAEALEMYQQFIEEAQARDATFLAEARTKLDAMRKRVGAQLRVDSQPSGSAVIIDGKIRGHTPLRVDLVAGEHLIRVRHRGTRTSGRRIVITPGEDITETFQLDAVGHLRLEASPSDALIRRKGVDDVGTGTYESDLSPGDYEFEVSLLGHRTRSVTISVREDDNIDKSIRLKPISDTAEIRITADIRGANVSIDGLVVGSTRDRDDTGPSLERRLMAGHHVIMVDSRDDKSWKKRVHLSPGETLNVDLKFRERTGRDVASWSLSALGTISLASGVVLGVLAIADLQNDSGEQRRQGEDRASTATLLVAGGAAGLLGGWFIKSTEPTAELERSHE